MKANLAGSGFLFTVMAFTVMAWLVRATYRRNDFESCLGKLCP